MSDIYHLQQTVMDLLTAGGPEEESLVKRQLSVIVDLL